MYTILRLVTISEHESAAPMLDYGVRLCGGWMMPREAWHGLSDALNLVQEDGRRRLVAMPSIMSVSSERRVDGLELLRLLDADIARLRKSAPKWIPRLEKWRKKIARVAEPQAGLGG